MTVALITGITGQDGSYLADQLHAEQWEVHGLVRAISAPGEQEVAQHVVQHDGDLLDTASLASIIDSVEPDVIFNLAGISSVEFSWAHPELTAKTSALSVSVLLNQAWLLQERLGRAVHFVQASSAEIFGAATETPQTELTTVQPVSPYGAAKAYAHHLVGVYRGRGLSAASAILYNHESPRRPTTFVTRKITSEVAKIVLGQSKQLLLGNLAAKRDWGWAPDYVDALVRIARSRSSDDFVIATGTAHTVSDFVSAAFAAAGIADWQEYIQIDERYNRPVDAPAMLGDSAKAHRMLGWAPTKSFDEIVTSMVAHDLELLSE
jgi:GDPmannose 4,6-dehydratase